MPNLPKGKRPKYLAPKQSQSERNASTPGKQTSPYNNARWRKHSTRYRREQTILRDGYGCEIGYYAGELRSAELTDHIIPIEQGGSMYDPLNHMAMSHYYHNKKRGKEAHGIVVRGKPGEDGLVPVDRMDVVRMLLGDKYIEDAICQDITD